MANNCSMTERMDPFLQSINKYLERLYLEAIREKIRRFTASSSAGFF